MMSLLCQAISKKCLTVRLRETRRIADPLVTLRQHVFRFELLPPENPLRLALCKLQERSRIHAMDPEQSSDNCHMPGTETRWQMVVSLFTHGTFTWAIAYRSDRLTDCGSPIRYLFS